MTAVIYLWCRQELMNLVFLLYIMYSQSVTAVIYVWCRQESDESSIFIVYYVILVL